MSARARLTFLVTWPDHFGGTELATLQAAEQLSASHDVEILGIVRDRDEGFFTRTAVPVRHLVDRRGTPSLGSGAEGLEVDDAESLDRRPLTLIDPTWEKDITLLVEVALEHALAAEPPDVLFATTPALLALAVQMAPRGTVVVGVEHRSTATRGRSITPLAQFGARADAIVTLTPEGAVWLGAMLGADAPALPVIPNMIRSGFTPQSPLTSPVIVAAGRHTAEKGFTDLVTAFAPVALAHPDWSLRIFGDGPETETLVQLVRRLGLQDQVFLVPPVADIPTEMARASALVVSSASEGLPLVMLEALAVGLPIVSYDCPIGPRHIVTHEANGLLVPPSNVPALSEALERLVSDPELLRRLGAGARDRREEFRPEKVAAAWRGLVDDLLEQRRVRPLRRDRCAQRVVDAQGPRALVVEPVTPRDEVAAVLGHVIEALESGGSTWFAVRTTDGWSEIAVDVADRERFLRRLAEASRPLVVTPDAIPVRQVDLRTDLHPIADVLRGERAVIVGLRSHLVAAHRSVRTVRVAFWDRTPDGALRTAAGSRATTEVMPSAIGSARVDVGGHDLPTLPAFSAPWATDVAFPVDAVFTWSAGDDVELLRYSLRGLAANAPWMRTVWLQTDDEPPTWLDRNAAGLRIVPSGLVSGIPGLAGHFLAIDVGMLIAHPIPPEQFFTSGGLTVHHLSAAVIPNDHSDGARSRLSDEERAILTGWFGERLMTRLAHVPQPVSLAAAGAMSLEANELGIGPLVDGGADTSPLVAAYWALQRGHGVSGSDLRTTYANVALDHHRPRLDLPLSGEPSHVVVVRTADASPGDVERAIAFMTALCPVASPWELSNSR